MLCFFCESSSVFSQNPEQDKLNSIDLKQGFNTDSIFTNVYQLNETLLEAVNEKDSTKIAFINSELGVSYTKFGNYKRASVNYKNAFQIYKSLKNKPKQDYILGCLLHSYALEKNKKAFDSVYPMSQALSKELNSETRFKNYITKIHWHYNNLGFKVPFSLKDPKFQKIKDENRLEDKSIISVNNSNYILRFNVLHMDSISQISTKALNELNKVSFESLNFSSEVFNPNLKKSLSIEYNLFQSFSLLKLNQVELGYQKLLEINEDSLARYVLKDNSAFSKVALFYFYKSQYFQLNKNIDSAYLYVRKSDSVKYVAIVNLRKEIAKNSNIISSMSEVENRLFYTNQLIKKDNKIKSYYIILLVSSALLLLVMGGFLLFYRNTKKQTLKTNFELKKSNDELIKTDRDRFLFLSVLSHELRTPIYGINGLATLISEEKNPEKQTKLLETLKQTTEYSSILINNALQVSRFQFEKKELTLEPTSIQNILKTIQRNMELFAKTNNLSLNLKVDKNYPNEILMIDRLALDQIIINLVHNAIKFSETGTISINVTETARNNDNVSLLFEIKDEGIGIDEKHQSEIFNAFSDLKISAIKNKDRGVGLGLYIVDNFLKRYDSQIHVKTNKGEGSNFYFNITFKIDETKKKSNLKLEQKLTGNILIVDDNKLNLLVCKKYVEKRVTGVCKAVKSGQEAIDIVKKQHFDLILMDINMPEMDGFEATDQIKKTHPNLPVIAISAVNLNEISKKAKQHGMSGILTKPHTDELFYEVVGKIL